MDLSVRLKQALDYEEIEQIICKIKTWDKGGVAQILHREFRIDVQDLRFAKFGP